MARRPASRGFDCPHCGARVRAGAAACRSCGSDLETGWSQDAELDLGSLPMGEGDFDYDAWLAAELGTGPAPAARRARHARLLAGLVLAAFLLWLLVR